MTTTYTLDVYAITDDEDSDPDSYFNMTSDDTDAIIASLIEMWADDHDETVDLRNERADEYDATVLVYDVCANDETVAIAYLVRN